MSKVLLVLGSVSALLGLLKFLRMLMSIRKKTSLLERLLDIDVISIENLFQKVSQSSEYTGFVSGILDTFPQEYIPSKIMPGIQLLYSKLILSTFNLRNPASVYQSVVSERMSSIFKLIDPKTGRKVKVLQTLVTNFGKIFDKMKSRTKKKSPYVSKEPKVWMLQLGLILAVQVGIAFTRFKNLLLPFSSGFLSWYHEQIYQEYYVPPGKPAVVYGKFIAKKDGLYTYKPQYITTSKESLIRMLQDQVAVSKRIVLLFGVILAPLVGWCGYKLLKLLLQRLFAPMAPSHGLEGITTLQVQSFSCPRCDQNLRNVVVKGCKHLSACISCAKDSQICSECSKPFTEFYELYVS